MGRGDCWIIISIFIFTACFSDVGGGQDSNLRRCQAFGTPRCPRLLLPFTVSMIISPRASCRHGHTSAFACLSTLSFSGFLLVFVLVRNGAVVTHELWVEGQVVCHAALCHFRLDLPQVLVSPSNVSQCAAWCYSIGITCASHSLFSVPVTIPISFAIARKS